MPLAFIKACALVVISELLESFPPKKSNFIKPTLADSPSLEASGIAIGVTVLFVKALNVIGVPLPVSSASKDLVGCLPYILNALL